MLNPDSETPKFEGLYAALRHSPNALDYSTLHGFLTGAVVGPAPALETEILKTAMGLPDETASSSLPADLTAMLGGVLDEVDEAIDDEALVPRVERVSVQGQEVPRLDAWCRGFLEAVAMNDDAWSACIEQDPALGQLLLVLKMVAWPEQYAARLFEDPDIDDPVFLMQIGDLVAPTVMEIVEQLDALSGGTEAEEAESASSLTPIRVRAMDAAELMGLVTTLGEDLPRYVVEIAAEQGAAMLPYLEDFLEDPAHWADEAADQTFWALVHSIFALGAMQSPVAADALVKVMVRLDEQPDHELAEWLDGYWPALFSNKRQYAEAALRALAEDESRSSEVRMDAMESLLGAGQGQNPGVRESLLDWIAQFAADPRHVPELRFQAGSLLLEFPRPRHAALLSSLAEQQERSGIRYFNHADIDTAFDEGDSPMWDEYANPWRFYEPAAAGTPFHPLQP